jgi:hypothetical protein
MAVRMLTACWSSTRRASVSAAQAPARGSASRFRWYQSLHCRRAPRCCRRMPPALRAGQDARAGSLAGLDGKSTPERLPVIGPRMSPRQTISAADIWTTLRGGNSWGFLLGPPAPNGSAPSGNASSPKSACRGVRQGVERGGYLACRGGRRRSGCGRRTHQRVSPCSAWRP